MRKLLFILPAIFLFGSIAAFAQDTTVSLETLLSESQKQNSAYREAFKNLLADEIKTFENYDKRGDLDDKTIVKSSFLVYQSGKKAASTAELRSVLEVNGKPIPDSMKRNEEFLAELEKEKTLESELRRLQKESAKYDKTWEVFGLTLNQAVVLDPVLRPVFDFQILGTEMIDGSEVYVVSYRQTKKSPHIRVNEKGNNAPDELAVNFNIDIPKELKKSDVFLQGKLWIDAKTFQLRREQRDLAALTAEPLVLLSNIFEYQPSNFGILVPKRITMTVYNARKEKGDAKYSTVKDLTLNFDYSNYRQTNVEVNILDEETE